MSKRVNHQGSASKARYSSEQTANYQCLVSHCGQDFTDHASWWTICNDCKSSCAWRAYHGICISLLDDQVEFPMIWTLEAIPEIYGLQCQILAGSGGTHFQSRLVGTGVGSEQEGWPVLPTLQNTAFQDISVEIKYRFF